MNISSLHHQNRREREMGITAKSKTKSGSENWGTGLLLVFFPEDNNSSAAPAAASSTTTTPTTAIVDKANLFCASSSSPSASSVIKRKNFNSRILTRAQSTISICALLVFMTLLLFTLSTFEPTVPTAATKASRRFLSEKPPNKTTDTNRNSQLCSTWFAKMWNRKSKFDKKESESQDSSTALQRLGTLYRRGARAMHDLVVGHVAEEVTEDELRLFLRALHRSGLTARADIVFIFGSSALPSRFKALIDEENESFSKLVQHYRKLNGTRQNFLWGFDVNRFVKNGKKETGEPLWGKRIRSNYSEDDEDESTRLSYGSVVGFEASELDPENSLAGFLDHVPMSLRRWACYPMLLGRVRKNFKHIMLLDVKSLLLLSDPLNRVRNHKPESVYISMKQETSSSKHGRKNSDRTQSHLSVNSAILMGGSRGVRLLSSAMLTEIVRAAMQHKKKNSVSESVILSQLVGNVHLLKNIELITSTESIPDATSLTGFSWKSASSSSTSDYAIIQRGNTNHDVSSIIMKFICSCEVDSSVYRDC